MDPKNLSWPTVVLLGLTITLSIGAIVTLSILGKDAQAIFTMVVLVLSAAGFVTLGGVQQIKNQTNGQMGAMQDQIINLTEMVRDLALQSTPPQQVNDQTQELPQLNQGGIVDRGQTR